MPPDAEPPDESPTELGRAGLIPPPLRDLDDRRTYHSVVAIDLGTSASTVTVVHTQRVTQSAMDTMQALELSTAFAELLASAPEPDNTSGALEPDGGRGLRESWEQYRDDVAARVAASGAMAPGIGPDALPVRLRGGDSRQSRRADVALLEATTIALETAVVSEDLRRWLAPRLLQAYDRAFTTPALAALSLVPVRFDEKSPRPREISSSVEITESRPLTVRLDPDGTSNVYHEVKSRLAQPEDIPAYRDQEGREPATTVDLVAHAYLRLIEATEKYLARDDLGGERFRLDNAVLTYPTTPPPRVRERLHRIAVESLGLSRVRLQYDEGVAAALYFLMRYFGGQRDEFGTEALRARSRALPRREGRNDTWQQHQLVIDIGAGTTDIALVRLTLADRTPADVEPTTSGRYYLVTPEVINSTGHRRLGGNLISLRVFHWLKAALLDALLAAPPEASACDAQTKLRTTALAAFELPIDADEVPQFAPYVVDNPDASRAVPFEIRRVTQEILPTANETAPGDPGSDAPPTGQGSPAFWSLWRLAERLKLDVCAGSRDGSAKTGRVSRTDLESVLTDMGQSTLKALLPEHLELSSDDFEQLISPLLDRVVALAGWLLKTSLGREQGGRLDRILLSGKPSQMPLLQRRISEALTGPKYRSPADLPPSLTIEHEYPKEAASIGAAWAQDIVEHGAGVSHDVNLVRGGQTVAAIDVANLGNTLPCPFVLMRAEKIPETLLASGTTLVELDGSGRIGARMEWRDQEWSPLLGGFGVYRPVDDDTALVWGEFSYEARAAQEKNFTPDPRLWGVNPRGDSGVQVRAQLEIDELLRPGLNLCLGRPHHVTGGVEPLPVPVGNPKDSSRLTSLPGEIWVSARPTADVPDGQYRVFPAWPEELPAHEYFEDTFHDRVGHDSMGFPGRISGPLPPPSASGDYEFELRFANDPPVSLGSFRVRTGGARQARVVATLDILGRLAVHRGYPPFWPAESMREVQDEPGTVLRVDMDPGPPDRDPDLDPFNGRQ